MEQQPISQIQIALTETAQRVNDWHQGLRQTHNLTNERLMGDPEDIWIDGGQGIIRVDKWTEYFWRTQHNLRFDSQLISRLQLNRLQVGNYHPLVARLYYPVRDFSCLESLSFSWEAHYSDILDESICFENGLIVNLVKFTEPGVLFPTTDDETQQILNLHFEYENSRLTFWIGRLTSMSEIANPIQYSNGQSYLKTIELPFGYPSTLDPTPHIEAFAYLHNRDANDLLIGA